MFLGSNSRKSSNRKKLTYQAQAGIGGAPPNEKIPQSDVENIIKSWQEKQEKTAQKIIEKYGLPNEATPSQLIWYNNKPWKKTIIYRDQFQHNFPSPHADFIEQTVNYLIPEDKMDEIAKFNGSISVNRTKGEVSVYGNSEEINFLTLNLADELIRNQLDTGDAREFLVEQSQNLLKGEKNDYLQSLRFNTKANTAIPD